MIKYKLCLVGYPLKKSLSPIIFKKIATLCNKEIEFDLIEKKYINPLKILSLDYNGFFITLPYKKVFYDYTIPDTIAKKLKIINCIKKHKNNFYSTNTDYKALLSLSSKVNFKNKTATIFGNGKTAYISAFFLIKKGVKKIRISARNHENSKEIINLIRKHSIKYEILQFPQIKDSNILINATPLGMYFNKKIEIKDSIDFVIDFAYNIHETDLIKSCIKNNIKHISGINILVIQALYGFKFITSLDIKKYYKNIIEELI